MKCVLCVRRGRDTDVAVGHVCVPCATWLQHQVADITRLAADAAAYITPGSSTSGGGRSVPSSRPPINVDAVDVELTPVPLFPGEEHPQTLLVLLEGWERMCREMRGMARYGAVSAARAQAAATLYAGTSATLVGVVDFLGRQVPWMTTEPDFPVDDFADEVRACLRVLRRWDMDAEAPGTMVPCPTMLEDGECGARLHYTDLTDHVTCRRCGQTRDAGTLALVAMSDGRDVWLDPEAAARHFCVDELALARWSRSGRIRVSHGRYLLSSIEHAIEQAKTEGFARLARHMAR